MAVVAGGQQRTPAGERTDQYGNVRKLCIRFGQGQNCSFSDKCKFWHDYNGMCYNSLNRPVAMYQRQQLGGGVPVAGAGGHPGMAAPIPAAVAPAPIPAAVHPAAAAPAMHPAAAPAAPAVGAAIVPGAATTAIVPVGGTMSNRRAAAPVVEEKTLEMIYNGRVMDVHGIAGTAEAFQLMLVV